MGLDRFYIGGEWVAPVFHRRGRVVDPASYAVLGEVALGNEKDVDRAVGAARRALEAQSSWTVEERIELLRRIVLLMTSRQEDIAQAIRAEIGVPITYARAGRAAAGPAHIAVLCDELARFAFAWFQGGTLVERVPIGVAALTTPWNVPINQMVIKIAPALAAGCTMVLKPSETAPSNAMILAEILPEAGAPAGVFNLVHGDGAGAGAGAALSSHPGVDFVSFTGSTRTGTEVSRTAAPTIKKVALELGGKSGNILLADVDLEDAVTKGVRAWMQNSGQARSAPTRMILPCAMMEEVAGIAARVALGCRPGDPGGKATELGPVASAIQWERVQSYIRVGIDEGARLVAGGPGRGTGWGPGPSCGPPSLPTCGRTCGSPARRSSGR